jgi:hypothetical protein
MLLRKSGAAIRCLEYACVFCGFFLMFLFICPQSDVFLFAQATDGRFGSVLSYSLNYGNGRLLGNVMGVYFSSHFACAGLIVSFVLTLLVVLLNCIFWDNSNYAIFPLALLIAVPSGGMVGECYYLFAGFCNYVVPIVLLLVGILIIKYLLCIQSAGPLKRYVLLAIDFVCTACVCLFSENTTIVAVVASVVFVIYWYIRTKKPSIYLILHLFAALLGTLIMCLIPLLTDTGMKMQSYRQVAATPYDIILQCVISLLRFADIFNQMYIPVFLLSFSMFFLCLKQKRFKSSLRQIQLAVFAAYPFLCIGVGLLDSHSLISTLTMYNVIDVMLVVIFIINILVTIGLTEDKSLRLSLWALAVITFFSVAPMMIVNQSGHRTYYTTFICMTVFSLFLLRLHIAEFFLKCENKPFSKSCFSGIAAACFLVITLAFSLQSLYNYDFYVIRSNYIAEKISANEDIYVPCLPYDAISVEDSWNNIIFFAFPSASDLEQVTISLTAWDGFDDYRNNILLNPIRALSFAFHNWEYKNPLLPESLCR